MAKSKKKNTKKYLLDTSCHYQKIKGDIDWIERMKLTGAVSFYSPYYVLYELKYGLLNDWVDFYYLVEIDGSRKALSTWTDKYGFQDRKQKSIILLQSLILDDLEKIPLLGEKSYLRSIEASIQTAMSIIDWNMSGYVGSFSLNELVQSTLFSREDYEKFSETVTKNKFVKFGSFVKSRHDDFEKIMIGLDKISKLDKKHKKVSSVIKEALLDYCRADMHNNSKTLADSVILLETLPKWFFVGKDQFHKISSKILNINFLNYKDI